MQNLRIVFAGTPDFAATHLQALLDAHLNVVGVYTQPDRPAGRGKKLTASPVKELALAHEITVYQPVSLKLVDEQAVLQSLQADLMVVVAYGLILPAAVLQMPRYGCINVHGSLLPKWRGAAPIQRSLWAGDAETGITIMQMDVGLDTGDMLKQYHCPITLADTSATLYAKLADIGAQGLVETIDLIAQQALTAIPQDNTLATYAQKLSKEEAMVDWSLSAVALDRCVRAFNPWPMSHTELADQVIKLWQAVPLAESASAEPGTIIRASREGLDVATGDGILRILELQLPGKKAMSFADVYNSRKELFQPGCQFRQPTPSISE